MSAAGRDVVLLHGFGGDRLSWAASQPALAPLGRILALDLPAHGAAPPDTGDGGAETLAERIAAALDREGIAGAGVVGHSLGGAVAAALARRRPDLVAALVLIAPAGLGADPDPGFLDALPKLETEAQAEALLHRLVVDPRRLGRQAPAHLLGHLQKPGIRPALARIAARLADAEAELAATFAAVAASGLPRLLVWGAADAVNPFDPARAAAFGGELVLVPDTGHLPHVEAARTVNAKLAAFIAERHAPAAEGAG